MAAMAPPLPGMAGATPAPGPTTPMASPGGPPPGLSGLVQGAVTNPPLGPTPEQKVQAYMEQVRNIHIQIDALAQQHPEAANDLNDAKNSLANSMSKVASAITSPDSQPQPPTF